MTGGLEYQDRNVERAVKKACKELKLSKKEIEYKVISHGASGIFGLVGFKKAQIRVILPISKKKKFQISDGKKEIEKKEEIDREVRKEEKRRKKIEEDEKIEKKSKQKDLPEEIIEYAKILLQKILMSITDDIKITVNRTGKKICFEIDGKNPAILIGKQGKTLEAIQYIIERIINKKAEKQMRVQVDVGGYLKKRQNKITVTAKRLAEKAKKTGRPVTIGLMNPNDRRTINIALKKDNTIRIKSMGDGLKRKIMIFPKKYDEKIDNP